MHNLERKIFVVTGGAGLIGQSFCRSILQANGRVVIADINESQGSAFTQKLSEEFNKDNVYYSSLDITKKSSIENIIEKSKDHFNDSIFGLVNNAYPKTSDFGKDFLDVQYDSFCTNLSSHLGGYFLTSQIFIKEFLNCKEGVIVNIASIYGVTAPNFSIYEGTSMTNGPEYAAIKSAVIHLTKFMAQRFKKNNIRINCISPGGILDGQPESFVEAYKKNCGQKGMLSPEDLSAPLLYLLQPYNNFMTGQNLVIDDGFCL